MLGLDHHLGTVVGVLPTINTLIVRPYDTGSQLVDIELIQPTWDQFQPAVGQQILYVEIGDLIRKPVVIYENDNQTLRKGLAPLSQRDRQIQGGGGSYILFDSLGRISLTDGSMVNNLQILAEGFSSLMLAYQLKTYGGLGISLSKDGELKIDKKESFDSDSSLVSFTIKKDSSVEINVGDQGLIQMDKNGKVKVSGSAIELLKLNDLVPGNVVTSGPTGTHGFDFTTGAPILGSQTIKASS